MEAIKKYWKALLLPLISYIILTMILTMGGYYGFHINIVLDIFVFFGLTYWFRKKATNSTERLIKTVLITTPVLFMVAIYIFKVEEFNTSPNFIFAQIAGILLAFLYEKVPNKLVRVSILCFPLVLGVWIYFQGATLWQHYIIYGTFKSGVTFKQAPSISFQKDSVLFTNEDFKDKIVVLNFWNSSCPYCYREFPILQEKYQYWSGKDNIEFYAINFPVKSDTLGQAEAILKQRGVNVPNLMGPRVEDSFKIFGEITFPLTIVLNSDGDIVFSGDINWIDRCLEDLIKETI